VVGALTATIAGLKEVLSAFPDGTTTLSSSDQKKFDAIKGKIAAEQLKLEATKENLKKKEARISRHPQNEAGRARASSPDHTSSSVPSDSVSQAKAMAAEAKSKKAKDAAEHNRAMSAAGVIRLVQLKFKYEDKF
jgi:hypothetical protein